MSGKCQHQILKQLFIKSRLTNAEQTVRWQQSAAATILLQEHLPKTNRMRKKTPKQEVKKFYASKERASLPTPNSKVEHSFQFASSFAEENRKLLEADEETRKELEEFFLTEKYLDEFVFGQLEKKRSVDEVMPSYDENGPNLEERTEQKEYEFLLLTPSLAKQPEATLDISKMETGDETTSRQVNRWRKIIYDEQDLSNSDLSKPPSRENPHPFDPEKEPMPPTHSRSLAQYANFCPSLQLLAHLGVDLYQAQLEDPRLGQALVKLDCERDVKPRIYWLHRRLGFSFDQLGGYLSRNPYFLFQQFDHLKAHLDYFNFRRFTLKQSRKIAFESRYWLNHPIERIDGRLGWLHRQFWLHPDQLRSLVVKEPRIIAFGIGPLASVTRSFGNDCGFSKFQLKLMLLRDPRLFMCDLKQLLVSYRYLAFVMHITTEQIVESPYAVRCPISGLRKRHEFLFRLRKANYVPETPDYISLEQLLHPSDRYFAEQVARTPIEDYNRFLRYI